MQLEDTRTMSALRANPASLAPAVPGFISAKDLARGDQLFFGRTRALRRGLATLAALALVTLLGALGAAAFGLTIPSELVAGAVSIALSFSALWFFASLLRRHPARVGYLGARLSHGADRFMRELRPYGHVITQSFPARAAAPDARGVASALGNRLMLNLRALCSDQQTLTLAPGPWVTTLLACSSDALIVDLSNGARQDWHLLQPEARRCVFVSAWGQHAQAEAAFASLDLPGQCFFYAPDGEIQRRGQFRAAMLAAMRAAHAS